MRCTEQPGKTKKIGITLARSGAFQARSDSPQTRKFARVKRRCLADVHNKSKEAEVKHSEQIKIHVHFFDT